jgi:hypothetical protein
MAKFLDAVSHERSTEVYGLDSTSLIPGSASPYASFPMSVVIRAAIWWWVHSPHARLLEPKTHNHV